MLPDVVMGLPVTSIKAPASIPTLVTVPPLFDTAVLTSMPFASMVTPDPAVSDAMALVLVK